MRTKKVHVSKGTGPYGEDREEPIRWDPWKHDGKLYKSVGIVNFWWMGYSEESTWHDPPHPRPQLTGWMAEHGVRMVDFSIGPPAFEFPTAEVAEAFRQRWHLPGAVQQRAFKKANRTDRPWKTIQEQVEAGVEAQRARREANWAKAVAARAAYLARRGIVE